MIESAISMTEKGAFGYGVLLSRETFHIYYASTL